MNKLKPTFKNSYISYTVLSTQYLKEYIKLKIAIKKCNKSYVYNIHIKSLRKIILTHDLLFKY